MGCNSSKDDVNVLAGKAPQSQAWTEERTAGNLSRQNSADSKRSKSGRSTSKKVRINSKNNVDDNIITDRSGSQYSLRSENGKRGTSATSKVSTNTFDSGLEEDFLPNMITEESEMDQQKLAENRPPTPELGVVGTQIQSRKSSSKSGRGGQNQTSDDILKDLRTEGLLAAFGQRQGGMSFDVMIAPDFGILKKPPARLASLKKKTKKRKELTKEELEAKMKAAEERRLRKEAKKIAKLNTSAKELKVHKIANDQERTIQEQAEQKVKKTLDKAAANREAHFKALKEKLEQKKKHAEKVRLAKLERLAEPKPTEEEENASAV